MDITLISHHDRVIVGLAGGRIHELALAGRTILSTYNRIDGKSGSTHVCVPNFANEGTTTHALPFHGPARNLVWQVHTQSESLLVIWCDIPQTNLYPAPLHIAQTFQLKDGFIHTVRVTNMGTQAVPVNIGIHNYFDTPHGWQGTTIQGADVTDAIATNSFVDARNNNILLFPHHAPLMMHIVGAKHLVTWAGVNAGFYDSAYACIEPVYCYAPHYFGSPHSMLTPGSTRTLTQHISVEE